MDGLHEKPLDAAGLRKFGLTTGLIFLGLFALIPWLRHHGLPRWPFYPGLFFIGFGLALPRALGPVYRVWMWLGARLGWINLRIILTVVFVVLLTPLGLVARVFGKDPMGRKLRRDHGGSYRTPATRPDRAQMTRPF